MTPAELETLGDSLLTAAMSSMTKLIVKGDWIAIDYNSRVRLPRDELIKLYQAIDMDRVRQLIVKDLEERIAAKVVASILTEIGTDVKSVMSNHELRGALKDAVRSKIEELQRG